MCLMCEQEALWAAFVEDHEARRRPRAAAAEAVFACDAAEPAAERPGTAAAARAIGEGSSET